jgi:Zn-dependent peptidase ImmA (M78 family)
MALRRGFKTEAHWYSRSFRKELGLEADSPLCPFKLANHLELPVIPLSKFREAEPHVVAFLMARRGSNYFSAVTIFPDDRRAIIHNDAHDDVRQHANLAHEISHAVLQHPPLEPFTEAGIRNINRDFEDEANWMGPALLVSEEAALSVARRGIPLAQAAAEYGVSVSLMRMRLGVTGALVRASRRTRAA